MLFIDLREHVLSVLKDRLAEYRLADADYAAVSFEPPKDGIFGDLATNAAIVLANKIGMDPKALAGLLLDALTQYDSVEDVDVAGAGFINFRFKSGALVGECFEISRRNEGSGQLGSCDVSAIVSAAEDLSSLRQYRTALLGDIMVNLFKKAGYNVAREYVDVGECIKVFVVRPSIADVSSAVMLKCGGVRISHSDVGGLSDIGSDVLRFNMLMARPEADVILDYECALAKSMDNAVFYVQYAHARLCAFERIATELGMFLMSTDVDSGLAAINDEARNVLREIIMYPAIIEQAAFTCEPHRLALYARKLADVIHCWYEAEQWLDVHDVKATVERVRIACAAKMVLADVLKLCGVNAPESM